MTDQASSNSPRRSGYGRLRCPRRVAGPATTGATASARHRRVQLRSRTATDPQPRALSQTERQAILDERHSERFVDLSPAEVWATLLDEDVYLGSQPTFYRLLCQAGEVRERRAQASHPATVKPELVAHGPNEVWSWDITKLRGPAKWIWYRLYVILDIYSRYVYSRYVVGWMVASRETGPLAEALIRQTLAKQGIARAQLTIHADRGSSMTSKPVAFLLADLGVTSPTPARTLAMTTRSARPSSRP